MGDSKVKYLKIWFDRKDKTYKSGELLTGNVLAEFTQPKKIRGLRIEIFGESVVGWSVSVPKPNEEGAFQDVMLTSREEYLSSKFYILGTPSGRAIELPVAQLSYPFSIQLPCDLPSSLEHSYGHIRYEIKAIFERPWKFDYETKSTFSILSNYDLNHKPQASLPIEEEIHKRFCCFCICPVGKVHVTIYVPASGYVPGQIIPVTIQCENESTVSVRKVKVSLQRKLKFYATAPKQGTKEEEVSMAETKCENPFTTSFEDHVTVQLKVPPLLTPSGLEYCSIIDLSYSLKVLIGFSGFHCNVERSFPFLIGTVPLHGTSESYNQHAAIPPPPSAHLLQEQHSNSAMPYVIMPQPSGMPQPAMNPHVAPTNPAYSGHWDPSTNAPPPSYDFVAANAVPSAPVQNQWKSSQFDGMS